VSGAWPWVAIALLGAYHGLDPSMGWLFAVALGLQENRLSKVLWALIPIAIGHLTSVALVVALIGGAAAVTAAPVLRITGGGILIAFGVFRLWKPGAHPRWVAMRVGFAELILWSFLMASAHGAGLMLFPILMGLPLCTPETGHQMPVVGTSMPPLISAAAVLIVHTSAMLLVMGLIAVVVYEWVGLAILRSAWINLDKLWAGALIAAGLLAILI
jgi:hypothetical protein